MKNKPILDTYVPMPHIKKEKSRNPNPDYKPPIGNASSAAMPPELHDDAYEAARQNIMRVIEAEATRLSDYFDLMLRKRCGENICPPDCRAILNNSTTNCLMCVRSDNVKDYYSPDATCWR